ncbi:hypothetical protein GCM10010399_82100 [Dactylosporangium fulvum]
MSGTPASAASAASASANAAAAACEVTAGAPFKSGSTVRANYLSNGCTGAWYISFYLQRSRGGGSWQTIDSIDYFGNKSGALVANCGGSGSYTYRNYREATNPAGITFTKASSSITFSC